MPRNRLTQLFALLLLMAAMTTTVFAFPPPDGNGGGNGGGDEEPPSPPPVTYLLMWLDDFNQLRQLNNNDDFIGEIPSLYGTGNIAPTMGLVYSGVSYVLDDLFDGTEAAPRYLFGLSNRLDDGSVYLCGSCDTIDGVRGWRMLVSPGASGLERVSFSVVQPLEGDDISTLKAVNIHGESVGYSYSESERVANGSTEYATLYFSDAETITISETGSRSDSFISDSGEVICPLEGYPHSGYGPQKIGSWSIESSLQILLDTADVGADAFEIVSFSDSGDFLFNVTETIQTRKGTSTSTTRYLYNGLVDAVPSSSFENLNSFGDLVGSYVEFGKGSQPNRKVNEVYFADLGITEEVDNMLDELNSQDDIDRWILSYPSVSLVNDYGVIVGATGGDIRDTFVLMPVPAP